MMKLWLQQYCQCRNFPESNEILDIFDKQYCFAFDLDLSNFLSESGLSDFRGLSIRLPLVCFVSVAGCHCFELYKTLATSVMAKILLINRTTMAIG